MADQAKQGLFSPLLQRARVAAVRDHLKGRVLDIGCGNGVLADHVPQELYLGVDRDAETLASARRLHPAHSFAADAPENELFDTVVALALLEHLPEPLQTMLEWKAHLKPGGRIVLTTPHKSLRWAHDFGSKIGIFSQDAADEHETMFDRGMLDRLGRDAGMRMVDYRRFLGGANQLAIYDLA